MILPGFIDIHIHGWATGSFWFEKSAHAVQEMCRHMTIAAELDGAREVLDFCRENGIQTAIGHSAATFEQIKAVKDAGIGGFTHTFSGMRGFHHRELGVAHEAFDIAYRLKGSERIIMTTDCSGLAQTQTEFDHYVRKMKFVKDGDRLRIDHYDGRQEWVDPRDYEVVKGIELSYVKSIQNMARHTKVGWHDIMRMSHRH